MGFSKVVPGAPLLALRLPTSLAHRVTAHLNAMRVMHHAIENAVRQCWIADLLVPFRDRQLRSQDHRPHLVAIFADLPQVTPFGFGEGRAMAQSSTTSTSICAARQ